MPENRSIAMDISVDPSIPVKTAALIRSLLASHFAKIGAEAALVKRLAGGGSNENFVIELTDESLVLRLAAPEVERFGIDRRRGMAAHERAAALGIAPALRLALIPEGHCLTPFVSGRVLDAELLSEPGLLKRCVETLTIAHHADPIKGMFSAFQDITRYLEIAHTEGLPLPADVDQLNDLTLAIAAVFDAARVPIRMCHNDVQLSNFIIGTDRTWLLDWEYAGMSNPYFDLAMLVSNGSLDEPAQEELLRSYFGVVRRTDIARLRLMRFVSAIREATWSVVAKPVLSQTGIDWDYQAWADLFFDRARMTLRSSGFGTDLEDSNASASDAKIFEDAARLAHQALLRTITT